MKKSKYNSIACQVENTLWCRLPVSYRNQLSSWVQKKCDGFINLTDNLKVEMIPLASQLIEEGGSDEHQ